MAKSLKISKASQTVPMQEPAVDIAIVGKPADQAKMIEVINEMCKSDAGRTILEAAADNDYTLSVTLDDLGAEGASWYEFGVSWDDDAE